jgi:DNA-binding XRE family transcriptional regulator
MTPLEQLNPVELGERLRIAREAIDINQTTAAAAIDVARTTIVAIEQGQRRVRMPELQQLAKLYGTSVNALLRQEAIQVDLAPRFRKLVGTGDAAVDAAAKLLNVF